MSTYTGVSNFQKTVRFFGPPCMICLERSRFRNDLLYIESDVKPYTFAHANIQLKLEFVQGAFALSSASCSKLHM